MTFRIFGAPHLYVQGEGALNNLPSIAAEYGKRPLIVADAVVTDLFADRLRELFGDVAVVFAEFGGECTAAEIDRISAKVKSANANVVIGMGGGKAIDTAKGVRIALDLPIIIVPTIASNDSPTSRLAVLYTNDHVLSEVRLMSTNPDAVIVDTALIVGAPVRFFVAGIGDALSKCFEVRQCAEAGGKNFFGGHPTQLALSIAQSCFEIIRSKGRTAVGDVSAHRVSPEVEDVVEACVLLSGLSFESGGLSIAHSLTRGFSSIEGISRTLHGEQVAFGLLVQLALEENGRSVLGELLDFYGEVGLPTSIEGLGGSRSHWERISEVTVETAPYIVNFERSLDAQDIVNAFRRLSEI
ncbi:glycerol dehydrogenase [Hoeflea sp. TYP-13]|uniref:glycerol dehydrogenase n=1 Tax=Hoeflea sp. TYP-13 TaxID=3230023 RepID=UPI0034C66413